MMASVLKTVHHGIIPRKLSSSFCVCHLFSTQVNSFQSSWTHLRPLPLLHPITHHILPVQAPKYIIFKSASSSPLYVQCPNSDSHDLFLAWFIAVAWYLFSFLCSFSNYIHLLYMQQNELYKTQIWTYHSTLEIFHWLTMAYMICPRCLFCYTRSLSP